MCVCVIDGEYVFMCKNVSEKEKYVFCVSCKRFSLKMCIREENVVCVSVSDRGGGDVHMYVYKCVRDGDKNIMCVCLQLYGCVK